MATVAPLGRVRDTSEARTAYPTSLELYTYSHFFLLRDPASGRWWTGARTPEGTWYAPETLIHAPSPTVGSVTLVYPDTHMVDRLGALTLGSLDSIVYPEYCWAVEYDGSYSLTRIHAQGRFMIEIEYLQKNGSWWKGPVTRTTIGTKYKPATFLDWIELKLLH